MHLLLITEDETERVALRAACPDALWSRPAGPDDWERALTTGDVDAVVVADAPGADLAGVVRRLRTAQPRVPVVLTAGAGREGAVIEAFREGLSDFVPRADLGGLAEVVRRRIAAVGVRRALEDRLVRAQRLEAIGALAGGVAHDLNNVLTPIELGVDLLETTPDEAARKPLRAALHQALERAAETVRRLQLFAREREGPRGPLALGPMIEEVADLLRRCLPKSIEVRTDVDVLLAPVVADPNPIRQFLLSLGVNAADAMPEGGRLTLTAANDRRDAPPPPARPGLYVRLAVADSGGGVPPDVRDRIFDPFFSTKGPGCGTGLGLPAVRQAVGEEGGFVEVDRGPDGGAEFRVLLPAAEARSEAERPPPTAGQGEIVLLVEDEPTIRDAARTALEASGYRVVPAADGAEAVALFAVHAGAVRAVVMDMRMPVMDGAAAVRALRRIDPAVRVVAVSGLNSPRTAGVADLHVQAFLQKPYSARLLLETLGDVLRG
jgi:signal transduction histidine kinase